MKNSLLITLMLFVTVTVYAQTPNIVLTQVVTGLSSPVGIANCGDDRLFVIEQSGYVRIIKNGSLLPTPFLNIDPLTNGSGEQGLLGLAFSPNYTTDSSFYIYYTDLNGNLQVSRYKVSVSDPDIAAPTGYPLLNVIHQPNSNHNGGNLMFGPDGYLYIGLGDGGGGGDPQGNGQNKLAHLGKMLRINVSDTGAYTIPPSNPFVGNPSYLPEIWAYGLRNPWRYSFDRLTGDLWIGDVGQNAYEEIDFQPGTSTGGENYGWRCYEASTPYNTSGCPVASSLVMPVYAYAQGSSTGFCVTGGFVYRGGKYKNLYGKYIYGDYSTSNLYMITKNGTTFTNSLLIDGTNTSWAAFGEDRYGELYAADYSNGRIMAITDTSTCLPVANINMPAAYSTCDSTYSLSTPYNPGMYYQWYLNGSIVAGADSNIYDATQDGSYFVTVTSLANFCQSNSDSVALDLAAPVAVTLSGLDTLYCLNWAASQLTGTPPGGTFSGAGVTGNQFDPAAAGVGVHNISYTYSVGSCFGVTQQTTTVSACTGIDNIPNTTSIRVVPNPSNGVFTLNFINTTNELITVKAENYLGQKVYDKTHSATNGDNSIVIDLGDVKTGWYLLTVKKGNAVTQTQIMVK